MTNSIQENIINNLELDIAKIKSDKDSLYMKRKIDNKKETALIELLGTFNSKIINFRRYSMVNMIKYDNVTKETLQKICENYTEIKETVAKFDSLYSIRNFITIKNGIIQDTCKKEERECVDVETAIIALKDFFNLSENADPKKNDYYKITVFKKSYRIKYSEKGARIIKDNYNYVVQEFGSNGSGMEDALLKDTNISKKDNA